MADCDWQIEAEGGEAIRSRSLWDETLPAPNPDRVTPVIYEAVGPQGRPLFLRAETLTLHTPEGEQRVRVIVAADYADIEVPVGEFGRDLAIALAIIGLCLTVAAALQVGLGLAPLAKLRKDIAAVRAHHVSQLNSQVPSEVRPLVEEVNQLLKAQEDALVRARSQAGDLAHGLKSPLAVLSAIARSIRRSGNADDATEILAQVDTMRRRIDRELARARLGPNRRASSRLDTLVGRLVHLLCRTPHGERIEWETSVDPEAVVSADEVDVAEVVGNILDNASKWARTKVRVTASLNGASVDLCIEDDGPGVPEDHLGDILVRGARLDDQREGTGLGLAIVNDIVAAYGAELHLTRSQLGGLSVKVAWPRAPDLALALEIGRASEANSGGLQSSSPQTSVLSSTDPDETDTARSARGVSAAARRVA